MDPKMLAVGSAAVATAVGLACAGGCVSAKKVALELELRQYQHDYLAANGGSALLEELVNAASTTNKEAIFDTFVCAHCGPTSKVPGGAWIKGRMGKSTVEYTLTAATATFLASEVLKEVDTGAMVGGKFVKGGPKDPRMVTGGPNRSDPNKTARCCVDYAIKADPTIELTLHQYQVDHLNKTESKSLSEMVAAAQLATPDFICAHCGPTNPLKGGAGMPGMVNSMAKWSVTKTAAAYLKVNKLPKVDKIDGKRQVIASSGAALALVACCRCSRARVLVPALPFIVIVSLTPSRLPLVAASEQIIPGEKYDGDAVSKTARICIDLDIKASTK